MQCFCGVLGDTVDTLILLILTSIKDNNFHDHPLKVDMLEADLSERWPIDQKKKKKETEDCLFAVMTSFK